MITETEKNLAVSKMQMGISLHEISAEMSIPLPLLEEWKTNMSKGDLIRLQANLLAVTKLANGEVLPKIEQQEEILGAKLLDVAIEIVDEISMCVTTSDKERARTLHTCADAVTKLYNAMVSKVTGPDGAITPSNTGLTIFQNIMKD